MHVNQVKDDSFLLKFLLKLPPALDFVMGHLISLSQQRALAQTHSVPKVITTYVSLEETEITDRFSNGKKAVCFVTLDKLGKLVQ